MKKFIIFFILFLVPFTVHAKVVSFSWTANDDETTVGYAILMDTGDNVVVDISDPTVTTTSYNVLDNKCHTFSIYAYSSNNNFSYSGNMISICPRPGQAADFTANFIK